MSDGIQYQRPALDRVEDALLVALRAAGEVDWPIATYAVRDRIANIIESCLSLRRAAPPDSEATP